MRSDWMGDFMSGGCMTGDRTGGSSMGGVSAGDDKRRRPSTAHDEGQHRPNHVMRQMRFTTLRAAAAAPGPAAVAPHPLLSEQQNKVAGGCVHAACCSSQDPLLGFV